MQAHRGFSKRKKKPLSEVEATVTVIRIPNHKEPPIQLELGLKGDWEQHMRLAMSAKEAHSVGEQLIRYSEELAHRSA